MAESDFAEPPSESHCVSTKGVAVIDARRPEAVASRQLIDEDAVPLTQKHQQLVDAELTRVEPCCTARLQYGDLEQYL